ncbi:lipopolysaccharide transport periplasmic protein LptA [Jiella sp. MQZ9-1]|uniref:Lipopolysaccharide transport periplasmic protein LptA n=1 Tax=Jiella flava TaxID=2816857 RepID=A0A939FT86_9HYPH|nr:lipopolysaccharide transport periplasmic protein LptA [Jiella flava]MBO0661508.1 lipopolysaccharide transport periplasmic protein LptA [Jiella flava]MCD2470150.1 lipopolysaccharide transport periplasmic protein LptA [Jiella flava]
MSSKFISRIAALLMLSLSPTLPALAQQNGTDLGRNFSGLQLRGDKPIAIESNQLDVDDRNNVATFSGNVSVKQGDVQLRSGKLIVYYKRDAKKAGGPQTSPASTPGALPGGSSQIDRLEATEKVYVKSSNQVATADKAQFDMAKKLVTLTGNVVLTQGDNVAEGCRLTIQMNTGVARLESQSCGKASNGRVRLMLTPGQNGSSSGN